MTKINLNELKLNTISAIKLLLRIDNISNDDPTGHEIVKELDHLPLALDLAGAIMEIDGLTPALFLKNYKADTKVYLDVEEDVRKATGNIYADTILTVWKMSFKRIKEQDILAAHLLKTFAFLHPDNIPVELFEKNLELLQPTPSGPHFLNKVINILHNYSLFPVSRQPIYELRSINKAINVLRKYSLIHVSRQSIQ